MRGLWVTAMLKKGVFWALHTRHLQNGTAPPPGFRMVIVLAFQICILLMGFTASFSSGPQLYESWHEFPIDLLYKVVSSLDTKWRHVQKFEDPPCPNSQYRVPIYWEFGWRVFKFLPMAPFSVQTGHILIQ